MKKTIKNNFIIIVLSTVFVCLLYYNIFNGCTYEVLINNKTIGRVENKEDFLNIHKQIQQEINNRFSNIEGKDEITFKRNRNFCNLSTKQELKNNFLNFSNISVETFGVFCRDKYLALIDNPKEYETVVKEIKNKYKKDLKLKNIQNFKMDNLKIKRCRAPLSNICMGIKTSNEKVITEIFNNQKQLKVGFIGEVDNLKEIQPSTVMKSSTELLKGNRKVQQQGRSGLKIVSTRLDVKDGKIINKNQVNERIIKSSKDKIILVGIKNPDIVGVALFSKPSRGSISSNFGRRWGRMHNGIDIAAPMSSPIYAASDGVVSFSGWQRGYGNIAILKHKDAYETRYAHCSKILVECGQKVKKGDLIARVGSTGNSTGPHVHFEVRKDGVPQNPINYIK